MIINHMTCGRLLLILKFLRGFCCTFLYVQSSFAIILMGKRELAALLRLSFWCRVIVVWLFLAAPWASLQFVIVVFPDHTQLLFLHMQSLAKNKPSGSGKIILLL